MDSSDESRASHASRLAQLMALDPQAAEPWQPDELAAMLRHRLSGPIQFDLGTLPPGLAAQLRTLSEAEGLLLKSFSDLFRHPRPPLELLRLTKDYARANMEDAAGPLPRAIAAVLYYTSIAVALTRCGKRITGLSNAELLRGLVWAMDQSWVDMVTMDLLAEARNSLVPAKAN